MVIFGDGFKVVVVSIIVIGGVISSIIIIIIHIVINTSLEIDDMDIPQGSYFPSCPPSP